MAVYNMTAAALVDVSSIDSGTTATPARLSAIEIQPHQQQANTVYIQIFNALASAVTLGATAPDMVIPVLNRSNDGGGTQGTWTLSGGNSRRYKVILPAGTFRFGTTISAAITTTSTGATAATTTSLPPLVRFFYLPYGN